MGLEAPVCSGTWRDRGPAESQCESPGSVCCVVIPERGGPWLWHRSGVTKLQSQLLVSRGQRSFSLCRPSKCFLGLRGWGTEDDGPCLQVVCPPRPRPSPCAGHACTSVVGRVLLVSVRDWSGAGRGHTEVFSRAFDFHFYFFIVVKCVQHKIYHFNHFQVCRSLVVSVFQCAASLPPISRVFPSSQADTPSPSDTHSPLLAPQPWHHAHLCLCSFASPGALWAWTYPVGILLRQLPDPTSSRPLCRHRTPPPSSSLSASPSRGPSGVVGDTSGVSAHPLCVFLFPLGDTADVATAAQCCSIPCLRFCGVHMQQWGRWLTGS